MTLRKTTSYVFCFLLAFLLLISFVLPGKADAAQDADETNVPKSASSTTTHDPDKDLVDLEITRENKDGDPVKGVKYVLYDKDDEIVWTGKTDKNGNAELEDIQDGRYKLVEKKVPAGEERDKKVHKFEIADQLFDGEDDTIEYQMTTLKIVAESEDAEESKEESSKDEERSEEKAEVTEDNEKDVVDEEKSDAESDGDTKPSKKEPAAEDVKESPVAFSIASAETTSDDELRDGPSYPYASDNGSSEGTEPATASARSNEDILVVITNTAQDGKDNNTPIENAEFAIYDLSGKEVYKGLTDENGELQCYLPPGQYTLEQTFTPDGYKKAKDNLNFEVFETGRVIGDTDIVSQPGSDGPSKDEDKGSSTENAGSNGTTESNGSVDVDLAFSLVSTVNNNPIVGAEISVEDENDKVVLKVESDKDGKVNIDKLDPGTYEIYQSTAADGYYKSSDRIVITVEDDGKITGDSERTFKSTPHGTVVITVVDSSTGDVIEGVKLNITDEDGTTVLNGTTDKNGTLAFAVPELGKYTVKETSVPSDYALNTSSYTFTVKDGFEIDGTTTIENKSVSTRSGSTSTSSGSNNSPTSSSDSGSGDASGDAVDSEGVPQTGVSDMTLPLVILSILLLIMAVCCVVVEQRRPDLFAKLIRRKGGNHYGDNT